MYSNKTNYIMKKIFLLLLVTFSQITLAQKVNYVLLSTDFIEAVKAKNSKVASIITTLEQADESELINQLNSDEKKKTFFINVYNAFTNNALRKNPALYNDRNKFFKDEQFNIAGNKISLDIIEHGFLRKSSVKLSLGKLKKIFPSKLEKKFRVNTVDYRIHFALNCGAKSCPPVDVYQLETLDKQLENNKIAYLKKNSKFDKTKNELYVTPLMSWFRGDFGNLDGVEKIIKDIKIIPQDVNPTLKFNDYDWTIDTNNFK